jgi:outer membrane protein OmpA-like peptidoglycan-associated protein
MVGWQGFNPKSYPSQNTTALFVGGGVDYRINNHFFIRPVQVDYVGSNYTKAYAKGVTNNLNGARVQAGIVLGLGSWRDGDRDLVPEQPKASASCSVEPVAVNAGTPVHLNLAVSGFNPKRTLSYSYSASSSKRISAEGHKATIDTAGLVPGDYTVFAVVSDNGKGKHEETARCQATYHITEPVRPQSPTLTISIQPTVVTSGEQAAVSVSGSSPDNRSLSYKCSASAGRLTVTGSAYTLDTAGVPAGGVHVNCTVSDDRNLSASASAELQVKLPPPVPVSRDFGTVKFSHDRLRPARVDNEAKGELDRYADALAAAPDAKGIVVGHATAQENAPRKGSHVEPQLAAERAVNTKDYVTREKGIDPARIQPRTGGEAGQSVELWILPAGASFPAAGSTWVDEYKVKAVPRNARPVRRKVHHKKHPVAPPAPAAGAKTVAPPAAPAKAAPASASKPAQAPPQPTAKKP